MGPRLGEEGIMDLALFDLLDLYGRASIFEPEVPVGPDASAQDRLLAHTGRDPLLSE
jgi:hypothetical protein